MKVKYHYGETECESEREGRDGRKGKERGSSIRERDTISKVVTTIFKFYSEFKYNNTPEEACYNPDSEPSYSKIIYT